MIYVLTVNGQEHMRGKELAIRSYVNRLRLDNYLIVSLEAYIKIRLSKKKGINMLSWDWEKLPVYQYAIVKDLIEKQKFAALLKIHNDYELSSNEYCCGTAVTGSMFAVYKFQYNKGRFDNENVINGLHR